MIGTTINSRYRIDIEIGRGGMGAVYRARDVALQRDVAVKLLSKTNLGTEGQARLLREAQIIAQLDHPNIVAIYDVGEYQGNPFIVMQLVEGGNLHDQKTQSLDETLTVVKQICAALEHAHQHGIIHRDLKPENVMLTLDGKSKLADFGLARSVASRMTSEGTIVGTVHYMAPEQALGHELDTRTDLYALGVMLYELTTGRLPFEGDSPVAVITQHINAPVVPPVSINQDLPPFLDTLILKLLEKDPDDRPASARAVRQILETPAEIEESDGISKEHSVLDRIVRGRIVGRHEEFEEARLLWQKTLSSEGQTLLISGEPGVGKTRLMRELVTYSTVTGGQALIGEAYSESNAPYGAMAQIVQKALASRNGLILPDLVLDDILDLVPELRPYFPDIASNPELDPESEQRRLFENMVSFCGALSQSAPLLLVLDDAHWADSSSIALFQHLARRTRKHPVMLLATYREIELRDAQPFNEMLLELNRQRLATRIKLGRLDREQTRTMLAAIFDEKITPEFLDGIYRETEGNPFFIEEVCRSLVESGKLYYSGGEWHRPEMEDLDIPQGVQVAIESRLMKLPEEVQDTLRMAAVLGREFDYEVLIEASDLHEDAVIDAIEMADRVQMVQEGRQATLYEFVHALVPQAIRENTHRLRRRRLHNRVAAAYEIVQPDNFEALAHHYSEGGSDKRALHYYTLAGRRALSRYANQDAENYFIAALNLTDNPKKRTMLLVDLGESRSRLSRYDDAVKTWQLAIDPLLEEGNTDLVAELFARSGRALWLAADTKSGLEYCRQGLSIVGDGPDSPGLARLLSETARACFFNGVRDEVEPFAKRALEMAEKYDLTDVRADSLNTLATSMGPESDEAVAFLEEAIQISESANLITEAMRATNNLGVLHFNRGNFYQAINYYRRAADLARKKGDLNLELFFSTNAEWSLMPLGRIHEVELAIVRLKKLRDEIVDPGTGARSLGDMEAAFFWAKGYLKESLGLWNVNIEEQRRNNDMFSLLGSLEAKTLILDILGQLEQAQVIAQEAIEVSLAFGRGVNQYSLASAIASQQGDILRAREYLEKAIEILGDDPRLFWRQINLGRAQAHLFTAERDWDAAWEKFSRNQEILVAKQMKWNAGWLQVEWADAHLLRGFEQDFTRARELLNNAHNEFTDMSCPGWVEMIDEKLAQLERAH